MQWLVIEKVDKILGKEFNDARILVWRATAVMWRDDGVGQNPKWTCSSQWFLLKDVQDGSSDAVPAQGVNQSGCVDGRAASDVHHDAASRQGCELRGAN